MGRDLLPTTRMARLLPSCFTVLAPDHAPITLGGQGDEPKGLDLHSGCRSPVGSCDGTSPGHWAEGDSGPRSCGVLVAAGRHWPGAWVDLHGRQSISSADNCCTRPSQHPG